MPSLEEIVKRRKPIRSPKAHKEELTEAERLAVYLHRHVGSTGFFFLLLIWTIVWLSWNIFAPVALRFDPAPAFVIWLFASNILQLILLPVIMVGQNIEGRAAERRAESDYEVNLRAEEELKVVLGHLENENELLLEILKKVDR